MINKIDIFATAALALTILPAGAYTSDMVLTYAESPGATNSSLADTSIFTFNGYSNGTHVTNAVWTGVGTYSQIYVINANQYGGANGTPYSVESAKSGLGGNPTTTLTLNTSVAYFGLWWSAGDPNNFLSFYSGNNLVASFNTTNLFNALPSTYLGNPTSGYKGQDATEKFAFLNFYGLNGTTFDKIVLSDPSTLSGFESDNHTVRSAAYGQDPNDVGTTLPGVPVEEIINNNGSQTVVTNTSQITTSVPEPGTIALLGLAGALVLGRGIRRR